MMPSVVEELYILEALGTAGEHIDCFSHPRAQPATIYQIKIYESCALACRKRMSSPPTLPAA